eukprot:jgi/Botrbrau1/6205/Bobra.0109s0001.1
MFSGTCFLLNPHILTRAVALHSSKYKRENSMSAARMNCIWRSSRVSSGHPIT